MTPLPPQRLKSFLCPYFILRFGDISDIQLQPHSGQKTDRAVGAHAVLARLRVRWCDGGSWSDSGGWGDGCSRGGR